MPAQVNVSRARKGRSVVPVTTNGGSRIVKGSASTGGDASVMDETVKVLRTDDIGKLWEQNQRCHFTMITCDVRMKEM